MRSMAPSCVTAVALTMKMRGIDITIDADSIPMWLNEWQPSCTYTSKKARPDMALDGNDDDEDER